MSLPALPPSARPTAATRLRGLLHFTLARPWWPAALLLAWLVYLPPTAMQRMDLMAYDLASRLRPLPAATDTAIVAIDERSLQALGRWPWRRKQHAELLDRLREAGAGAVALDLLFTEPSPAPHEGDDRQLADAIARFGPVALPVAPMLAEGGMRALPPLPVLAASGAALGHVDAEVDADAVTRRLFLRAGAGGRYWDALPLALWRQQHRTDPDGLSRPTRLASRLADAEAAPATPGTWARHVEALLPAASQPAPTLSYIDVLRDPAVAARLAGRAVWVGVTATGLSEPLSAASAPPGTRWSAVQWHAHAYQALDDGRLVTQAAPMWSLGLGLLPLLLIAWLSQPRGARRELLMPLAVLLPPLLTALLLGLSIWVPMIAPTLAALACWLAWRARRHQHTLVALERSREQADTALRAIADAVITVDTRGRVRYLNPVAAGLAGRSSELSQGLQVGLLYTLDADDLMRLEQAVNESIAHRQPVRPATPLRIATLGGERMLRLCVSPVQDNQQRVDGAVIALSDVTDVLGAARQLQFEATHDALTGLPNRVLLADRLAQAITTAQRSGRSVAVMFMDLDRFKRINDSLGHRLGDSVLRTVAQRLSETCRAKDTIARWGGDEFVIMLDEIEGRDAVAVVAGKLIDAVSQDLVLDGIEVQCSCSIGIAMAPQDSTDPDALLAMADTAMYRGKAQAGRRFEFYAADMNAWSREWLALETRLRQALARNEFVLHYQFQVRVSDGHAVGLEALLRWPGGDGGEPMPPSRFIGVAEETGLIVPMGTWVLETAALQLTHWLAAGLPPLAVSINVSARQCLDRSLVRQVAAVLRRTGLPPHLLKLEITETTVMTDVEHVTRLLEELHGLGVSLAVDDFGTGYSSLAYLKRFPIDELKIDQSFVHDIAQDPNDAAIVRATIALAHGLGMPVVAEGVETAEQARFLAEHGCDMAQGYFYARPMGAEAIEVFLRAQAVQAIPQDRASADLPM